MNRRTFTLQLYDRIEPDVSKFGLLVNAMERKPGELDISYRNRIREALGDLTGVSGPVASNMVDAAAKAFADNERLVDKLIAEQSLQRSAATAVVAGQAVVISNGTFIGTAGEDVTLGAPVGAADGTTVGHAMHPAKKGEQVRVRLVGAKDDL